MKELSGNVGLLELDLTCCCISSLSGFMQCMEKNRTLETLILERNQIWKEFLLLHEGLKHNSTLTKLNIDNCGLNNGADLSVMKDWELNSSLQLLKVSSNFLEKSALNQLSEYIAADNCRLRHLDIHQNDFQTSLMFKALISNHSILEFSLSSI
jgi:hypothetical protein